MRLNIKFISFLPVLFLGSLIFSSCQKKEAQDLISVQPEIELISIAPLQVNALQDPVIFEIKYTDGDGDLGSNEQGAKNLFIRDQRIGAINEFRIKQLAPETGDPIPITGTLKIELQNVILTGNGTDPEEVSFEIWVVDRAGNQSNTISAGPVTVNP